MSVSSDSAANNMGTPGERQHILRMLYKIPDSEVIPSAAEAERQCQDAQQLLRTHIQNLAPDERAAYDTVIASAPYLLNVGIDPVCFLRHANNDAAVAAQRLAAYFRHWQLTFGEQQAQRPLTIDGQGALGAEDLAVLQTGFLAILPPRRQRPVVIFDRSRLDSDFSEPDKVLDARLRSAFYVLSVLSEQDVCRTLGFDVLVILNTALANDTCDELFFHRTLSMLHEAMPIRLHEVHLITRPPRVGRRTFLESAVPRIIDRAQRLNIPGRMVTHIGHSQENLGEVMAAHDFDLDDIPRALGGTWNYHEQLQKWRHRRLMIERAMRVARGPDAEHLALDDRVEAAAAIFRDSHDANERRDKDAFYARRKRARRKIEVEVLQDQVNDLRRKNYALRRSILLQEDALQHAQRWLGGGGVVDDRKPAAVTESRAENAGIAHRLPHADPLGRTVAEEQKLPAGWEPRPAYMDDIRAETKQDNTIAAEPLAAAIGHDLRQRLFEQQLSSLPPIALRLAINDRFMQEQLQLRMLQHQLSSLHGHAPLITGQHQPPRAFAMSNAMMHPALSSLWNISQTTQLENASQLLRVDQERQNAWMRQQQEQAAARASHLSTLHATVAAAVARSPPHSQQDLLLASLLAREPSSLQHHQHPYNLTDRRQQRLLRELGIVHPNIGTTTVSMSPAALPLRPAAAAEGRPQQGSFGDEVDAATNSMTTLAWLRLLQQQQQQQNNDASNDRRTPHTGQPPMRRFF